LQLLAPDTSARQRICVFVPRWRLYAEGSPGLPYRAMPVVSSLLRHGFEVDFATEPLDPLESSDLRGALARCQAAVGWCAELNPGLQLPGIVRFLALARELAPRALRVAGGGFFPLVPPPRFDLAPLTDAIVADYEHGSLARLLARRLGGAPIEAQADPFDVRAVAALDLAPFLRPEPMVFGNDRPSLQIPTGAGCGKHCRFCFYEQTQPRLLPAGGVIELARAAHRRYGVTQLLLGELDFLSSRGRARTIAAGFLAEQLPVRWFALASVQDVLASSDELLALLRQSGCHMLEVGPEVGGDAALERIGKAFRAADAERAVQRMLAHGIVPMLNIMLGHAGETPGDRRATLAMVRRLQRLSPRVRFNFRLYQAIPTTSMGEEALRGVPPLPSTLDQVVSARAQPERMLPWLSARAEREARFLADYALPLAYDDSLRTEKAGLARRALAALAGLRCRTGFLRWPLDRALFARLPGVALPTTYVP
jgi:radical SAM superfamily enzyme YgiQ (UPF0313 family)